MTKKQQRAAEMEAAIATLASKIPFGELKAATTPIAFLREVAEEIDTLRAKALKLGKHAAAMRRVVLRHYGARMTPWLLRNSVRDELGVPFFKTGEP